MHYAISDVHGHTKTLIEFAESLQDNDKTFILGDVIDKGDGTLDALRYIMKKPQFEMIMGNHEMMFIDRLYWMKKVIELEEIDDSKMTKDEKEELEKKWHIAIKLESEAHSIHDWNDGVRTMNSYLELSVKEQDRIFDYLVNLPIQIETTVNNKDFVLVHAVANPTDKAVDGKLYFNSLTENDPPAEDWVWNRIYYKKWPGKLVVTGHNLNTYTFGHSSIESDGKYDNEELKKPGVYGKTNCLKPFNWACIDTSLAVCDPIESKLGILTLEDLAFEVRENLDEKGEDMFYD